MRQLTEEDYEKKHRAFKQGLKKYNNGRPCKHGHIADRLISNDMCIICLDLKTERARYKHRKKNY